MRKVLLFLSFLFPVLMFADSYDDVLKNCGDDVSASSSKLKLAILKSLAGGSDPCVDEDPSVLGITSKCKDSNIKCDTILKAFKQSQEKGKVIGK